MITMLMLTSQSNIVIFKTWNLVFFHTNSIICYVHMARSYIVFGFYNGETTALDGGAPQPRQQLSRRHDASGALEVLHQAWGAGLGRERRNFLEGKKMVILFFLIWLENVERNLFLNLFFDVLVIKNIQEKELYVVLCWSFLMKNKPVYHILPYTIKTWIKGCFGSPEQCIGWRYTEKNVSVLKTSGRKVTRCELYYMVLLHYNYKLRWKKH